MKTKRIIILLIILGVVSAPVAYVLLTKNNFFSNLFERWHGGRTISVITPALQPKVTFEIQKTDTGNELIIRWDNLQSGTARIKIYRAKPGTTDWVLWKIVNLTDAAIKASAGGSSTIDMTGGSGEGNGKISISLGADDQGFVYYAQGVGFTNSNSGTGGSPSEEVLWNSPGGPPTVLPPPPPPPSPPTPPAGGPSPSPSGNPPPPAPTPPTPAPATPPPAPGPTTPPPTTTPPPPPTPSYPPGTVFYYTPQGTVSGTSVPPTDNFWVQIINGAIEFSWQNLPSSTDMVALSRSDNQNGPWTETLRQNNPVITGPYSIRLVDNALYNPNYYKLDCYASGSLVASYGPLFLNPQ